LFDSHRPYHSFPGNKIVFMYSYIVTCYVLMSIVLAACATVAIKSGTSDDPGTRGILVAAFLLWLAAPLAGPIWLGMGVRSLYKSRGHRMTFGKAQKR
jgi:hypothetical protein